MPNDSEPPSGDSPVATPPSGENLLSVHPDGEQPKQSYILPFLVVAIGASAGGLEAYIELFAGLPVDTGLPFVVIPHLSPEFESHLIEILTRHTSMPVQPISDDTSPEPNQVYVLPPAAQARFEGGKLRLRRRGEERMAKPIDAFLASLAADQKHHAIGIILSGTGSDGSLGLKAIKAEGGIAMVQEPDTARFPEMPRSSILADHVDLVLPPGKIGPELSRIGQQFLAPEIQPLESGELRTGDEPHFGRIMTLLRSVSGIDFRQYKPTTVRRRLARRMMLRHFHRLDDYLRHLQTKPEELRELQEDLVKSSHACSRTVRMSSRCVSG